MPDFNQHAYLYRRFIIKHFTSPALSCVLAPGCSGASFAAAIEDSPYFPFDARSSVVKYSDLNLADSVDAHSLLRRLELLAREPCKRQSDIRQLNAVPGQKRCIAESYKNAIVAINRQTGVDTEALAARAAEAVKLLLLSRVVWVCTSVMG